MQKALSPVQTPEKSCKIICPYHVKHPKPGQHVTTQPAGLWGPEPHPQHPELLASSASDALTTLGLGARAGAEAAL